MSHIREKLQGKLGEIEKNIYYYGLSVIRMNSKTHEIEIVPPETVVIHGKKKEEFTKILKYQLESYSCSEVAIPIGGEVICANVQGNEMYIWVRVNPKETKTEVRTFQIFGTGWPINNTSNFLKYVNTVFPDNGTVWHVFEQVE
jgi:hypothetical protein